MRAFGTEDTKWNLLLCLYPTSAYIVPFSFSAEGWMRFSYLLFLYKVIFIICLFFSVFLFFLSQRFFSSFFFFSHARFHSWRPEHFWTKLTDILLHIHAAIFSRTTFGCEAMMDRFFTLNETVNLQGSHDIIFPVFQKPSSLKRLLKGQLYSELWTPYTQRSLCATILISNWQKSRKAKNDLFKWEY